MDHCYSEREARILLGLATQGGHVTPQALAGQALAAQPLPAQALTPRALAAQTLAAQGLTPQALAAHSQSSQGTQRVPSPVHRLPLAPQPAPHGPYAPLQPPPAGTQDHVDRLLWLREAYGRPLSLPMAQHMATQPPPEGLDSGRPYGPHTGAH
jgi:hypothetical protein